MTLKHLVLFDIDGTLLSTNGDGVSAMMEAYTAVWGRSPERVRYSMSGKTELQISYELLGLLGFTRDQVRAGLPDFFRRYPEALRRRLRPERTTVHPGIRELVTRVGEHPEMVLGLLTGNCRAAARIKLEVAGLDGFAVRVFGEHHEQRSELPPLAMEAARALWPAGFSGKAVVILGDTPNDILCARAVGAKSIAVATGRHDLDALAAHEPDHLFPDFSRVEDVLAAIRV
jgi:phosphoglycolate phosphatase-like HAD superfamily hydrolase